MSPGTPGEASDQNPLTASQKSQKKQADSDGRTK